MDEHLTDKERFDREYRELSGKVGMYAAKNIAEDHVFYGISDDERSARIYEAEQEWAEKGNKMLLKNRGHLQRRIFENSPDLGSEVDSGIQATIDGLPDHRKDKLSRDQTLVRLKSEVLEYLSLGEVDLAHRGLFDPETNERGMYLRAFPYFHSVRYPTFEGNVTGLRTLRKKSFYQGVLACLTNDRQLAFESTRDNMLSLGLSLVRPRLVWTPDMALAKLCAFEGVFMSQEFDLDIGIRNSFLGYLLSERQRDLDKAIERLPFSKSFESYAKMYGVDRTGAAEREIGCLRETIAKIKSSVDSGEPYDAFNWAPSYFKFFLPKSKWEALCPGFSY
jgi:hypothetical protein